MKYKSLLLLLMPVLLSYSVKAQEAANDADTLRKDAVKIYLDCMSCDMNYTREEIPYVNYVRDVREAEVYILVTSQNTGSGGTAYTVTLQGQGKYAGMNDTLVYSSNPDETSTVRREKKTNMIKMGLMRYVARTPLFSEIDISHDERLRTEQVVDKWNNWVFEISTEPQFESEEANKELDLRNSFSVRKVTEKIKFDIDIDQFYNKEIFIEYADTDSSEREEYYTNILDLDNLVVWSLGDHWSTGFKYTMGSSTRENYEFTTTFLPSVEYDIYPYSESTHRQLRILYGAGIKFNNYADTTIYNMTEETLYLQSLNIAYQIRSKWGSINIAFAGSNYLHDFSKNRVELFGNIDIRVFKGLSIRLGGGVAHINDQLNLKKGDISEAERLLKLTEFATKYRVDAGIEITYTFGSIYNNVVNPRFGNGYMY
jgi:hypothetical protein